MRSSASGVVRVAAGGAAEPRLVEHERDARSPARGRSAARSSCDCRAASPARRRDLEQRVARSPARIASAAPQPSRSDGPPSSTVSRAADGQHQVGVDEGAGGRGSGVVPRRLELDELRASASWISTVPRKRRGEAGETMPSRSSSRCCGRRVRPVGDEQRLPLGRDARAARARPTAAASAAWRGSFSAPGSGSAGGSTTIVARPPRGHERLERLAREREAERVAHRRARRRRPASPGGGGAQHDGVVGHVDDGQARCRRGAGRAALRNRAVEPQERRRGSRDAGQNRDAEQVRHPPVGRHRRVAVLVAPSGSRAAVSARPTPVPRASGHRVEALREVDPVAPARADRVRPAVEQDAARRTRPSRSATNMLELAVVVLTPFGDGPPRASASPRREARRRIIAADICELAGARRARSRPAVPALISTPAARSLRAGLAHRQVPRRPEASRNQASTSLGVVARNEARVVREPVLDPRGRSCCVEIAHRLRSPSIAVPRDVRAHPRAAEPIANGARDQSSRSARAARSPPRRSRRRRATRARPRVAGPRGAPGSSGSASWWRA